MRLHILSVALAASLAGLALSAVDSVARTWAWAPVYCFGKPCSVYVHTECSGAAGSRSQTYSGKRAPCDELGVTRSAQSQCGTSSARAYADAYCDPVTHRGKTRTSKRSGGFWHASAGDRAQPTGVIPGIDSLAARAELDALEVGFDTTAALTARVTVSGTMIAFPGGICSFQIDLYQNEDTTSAIWTGSALLHGDTHTLDLASFDPGDFVLTTVADTTEVAINVTDFGSIPYSGPASGLLFRLTAHCQSDSPTVVPGLVPSAVALLLALLLGAGLWSVRRRRGGAAAA